MQYAAARSKCASDFEIWWWAMWTEAAGGVDRGGGQRRDGDDGRGLDVAWVGLEIARCVVSGER